MEIRFHCLHYHRRTQPLHHKTNIMTIYRTTPMVSSFKSTLPSDNNNKTTTIVGDWWCRVIVEWLEVRLGGIGAHNVSEEGCCYGATLLLNRSAESSMTCEDSSVSMSKCTTDKAAYGHCWHRWNGQSVFSLMRWMISIRIYAEWQGSVGLINYYHATKRYTNQL